MTTLNYNQKKILTAYEIFFGSRYQTYPGAVNNTETHTATQEMCFLLKISGIEIGDFQYSWNLRGPFSPGLLALMRSMDRNSEVVIDFYENETTKEEFSPDQVMKIDGLREILEIDEYRNQCVRWVEILGSLTYIARTMLPGSDFETVNQRFIQEKPEYSETSENQHAWNILNKARLLPTMTQH